MNRKVRIKRVRLSNRAVNLPSGQVRFFAGKLSDIVRNTGLRRFILHGCGFVWLRDRDGSYIGAFSKVVVLAVN